MKSVMDLPMKSCDVVSSEDFGVNFPEDTNYNMITWLAVLSDGENTGVAGAQHWGISEESKLYFPMLKEGQEVMSFGWEKPARVIAVKEFLQHEVSSKKEWIAEMIQRFSA